MIESTLPAPVKLLQSGPHVDRLITLLAWRSVVTNPVEYNRYWIRINAICRDHPELAEITANDPRVETRAMKLREGLDAL